MREKQSESANRRQRQLITPRNFWIQVVIRNFFLWTRHFSSKGEMNFSQPGQKMSTSLMLAYTCCEARMQNWISEESIGITCLSNRCRFEFDAWSNDVYLLYCWRVLDGVASQFLLWHVSLLPVSVWAFNDSLWTNNCVGGEMEGGCGNNSFTLQASLFFRVQGP